MKQLDYEKLSKEISYALRHAPWEYELELDNEGWVLLNQLTDSLHENEQWKDLQEKDIAYMIDISKKKRHEIKGQKIRAFYGHSIPMKITKKVQSPPPLLYHGTARRVFNSILEKGLLPNGRQYVHLSIDIETAKEVGKRRDSNPIILSIEAQKAFAEGILFYHGNEKVWLADEIPPQYIIQI